MAAKSKRNRDYSKEYQVRLARKLAEGKSVAEARGHARASDLPKELAPVDKNNRLEKALKRMKAGATQKQAAKEFGISVEKLRRYQKINTTSTRAGRKWIIVDARPVSLAMATRGRVRDVTVSHDAASDIGHHWHAINRFLNTNDSSHMARFVGLGLRDINSQFHPFETRPNVLRRLDSIGELDFLEIYRPTAQ